VNRSRWIRSALGVALVAAAVFAVCHATRPAAAQPKPATAGPRDAAAPQSELKVVQQVNASIDRGLEFLAARQRKDGGWHANNAINSLALLAFMGRGHTPGRGRYPDVLEKGKKFVLANAQDNPKGYLAQFGGGSMYEHGLTTLALAEMYGMDPDPELENRLRAAVTLIEKTQSPRGGWRYSPSPDNQDLSVTVMQIVALRAANNAEIPVSQKVIDNAIAYVKSCNYPAGGYGYEGPGQGGPTSAAGVLSLQLLGKPNDPGIPKTMDYLKSFLRATPKEQWENHGLGYFYYFHYYAMQAHYQYGGTHWNNWHPMIRDALLLKQNADGSWDVPAGSSEAAHTDPNKVYPTAMACLVLDIYLHFLPAYKR
jgi:hypothetical protein